MSPKTATQGKIFGPDVTFDIYKVTVILGVWNSIHYENKYYLNSGSLILEVPVHFLPLSISWTQLGGALTSWYTI